MVRSYERHEPTAAYALICSNAANSLLQEDGKTAFFPALEDVLVWDMKRGEQVRSQSSRQCGMWHEIGYREGVTAIARTPFRESARFAVGYADGSIRLWDPTTSSVLLTFHGHRRAITQLTFDAQGMILVSGSQDNCIIVWDPVSESGLFKLKGHNDMITGLALVPYDNEPAHYLASTAKDGLLKLWDLKLQHCVETAVSGDEQLWSLAVRHEEGEDPLVMTGGSQGHVRLWTAHTEILRRGLQSKEPSAMFLVSQGMLELPSSHRVAQLAWYGAFVAAASGDRSVHVYRLRTADEAHKKQQRRLKRAREKGAEAAEAEPITWLTRLEAYVVIRPTIGRVRSFAFPLGEAPRVDAPVPLLCALTTNSAEIHTIPPPPRSKSEKQSTVEAQVTHVLELPGHRSDVRAVALSSDDALLASVCGSGQLKIWNVRTGRCVRTLPVSAFALCVTWLPGDRYVLVGCKDGTLHSFDVPAGLALETLEAHTGPIWSVHVHPSGLSAVTGSADKQVKFWDFEMAPGEQESQLSLVHVRTLKLTDDVLCTRFSPDGRLLAVSLLDNTVKVFYVDSLKFFLSLYGHKLPVLSLDISGDSKLCVTCSADKNVKIWGLDFGDCHRSLFAHDDSIMQVAFEHGQQGVGLMGGKEGASHRFWTVGKDAKVKYWDGDRFLHVQTMEGHHGEVWALATGHQGRLVVTAGADRSIRVWEKTDEPLFLEEEREKELEKMYESAAPEQPETHDTQTEAEAVSKPTTESLMAGERVMEALDTAEADLLQRAEAQRAGQEPMPVHPLIQAAFGEMEEVDTHKYVLRVLEKIPPTHLEDALLVLPFDRVVCLFRFIDVWVTREWNVSLASRMLFFLMRTHHTQIVANRVMRTTLVRLRSHVKDVLAKQKTLIGFNVAALRYMQQQHVARRTTELFEKPEVNLDELDEASMRERIQEQAKRKRKLIVR
ncbi:beta transducin [Malassezia nana]|uniref:Beta transducin n=1 Tax=Malassezia nana TaxID=180528 RepID=A0AAF0J0P4_9BASI|nr:beta transducin [Malassezia nana]